MYIYTICLGTLNCWMGFRRSISISLSITSCCSPHWFEGGVKKLEWRFPPIICLAEPCTCQQCLTKHNRQITSSVTDQKLSEHDVYKFVSEDVRICEYFDFKIAQNKKNAKSHYLKPIGTMYSSKASCYKNFLILFLTCQLNINLMNKLYSRSTT